MSWNKNPPPGVNPQYSSFHYNNARFESEVERKRSDDYTHKPGKPGGGWDVEDEPVAIRPAYQNRQESFSKPANNLYKQPEASRPEPVVESRSYDRQPALAVSEQAGVYEKVLVEDITTPGGVRPRPPDKDMQEFLNKCKYLSPEIIIPLLVSLLDNSQRMFKALCVIEKLVFEYEGYADVTAQFVDRIRSVNGNQNTQKVIMGILSRYHVAPQVSQPANIIDLF